MIRILVFLITFLMVKRAYSYNEPTALSQIGHSLSEYVKSEKNYVNYLQNRGEYDRIINLEDFRGDIREIVALLQRFGIITFQKDYYADLIVENMRKKIKKVYKEKTREELKKMGFNNKKKNDFNDDPFFSPYDITNNMLYNKREHLMSGTTADEYHWGCNKTLVVINGHIMNSGPDDIGILYLFMRLTVEARLAGGCLVVLLGNHEIDNLLGDFSTVHPLSLEKSGGLAGRVAMLSSKTKIGRFLRTRPVIFTYDGLVFVHGGLYPAAIKYVEKKLNKNNISVEELVAVVNKHVQKMLLMKAGSQTSHVDKVALLALNKGYSEDIEKFNILLAHPIDECQKVKNANILLGIQAQMVSHSPHDYPDFDFCNSTLFSSYFKSSNIINGQSLPLVGLEMLRQNAPFEKLYVIGSGMNMRAYDYKWSVRLVIPAKSIAEFESLKMKGFNYWYILGYIAIIVAVIELITTISIRFLRTKTKSDFFLV